MSYVYKGRVYTGSMSVRLCGQTDLYVSRLEVLMHADRIVYIIMGSHIKNKLIARRTVTHTQR